MFALDTNVVSEIARPQPDLNVMEWLAARTPAEICLPTVVIGELLTGVERLPPGRRRDGLRALLESYVASVPTTNILEFGTEQARVYALIVAGRERIGRPINALDAQIAATALASNMAIVTRNTRDFDHCGVEVINPWEAGK